jgi:hypothetical protein
MHAHALPRFHDLLTARLMHDHAFAFAFAAKFRDVPPVEPDHIAPLLTMRLERGAGLDSARIDADDLLLFAKVRDDAPALPGRQPWPRTWALSIACLDTAPPPEALLGWPHRLATLRAQLRTPVTSMVVVPSLALALRVNEVFGIEPELTPVVVVSEELGEAGPRDPTRVN